jgi:outer membrane protein assembly factor BamB
VPGAERIKWVFALEQDDQAGITVNGSTVYVNTSEGLYALAGKDGSQLWFAPDSVQGRQGSAPQLLDGVFYAINGLGSLVATKAADGSHLWSTHLGYFLINATVVPTSSAIYAWAGGQLYAVSPAGNIQWQAALGKTTADTATAGVAVGSLLYLNLADGYTYAVNASDGSMVWQYPTQSAGAPAVVGGVVYAGSADKNLYALDAESGGLLWSADLTSAATGPLVISGNLALVGTNAGLVALNLASRQVAWIGTSGGSDQYQTMVTCLPVVSGSSAYAISSDGTLIALRLSDGSRLWAYPIGSADATFPALAAGNGLVYLDASDLQHKVYALDASANS